MGIKFIRDDKSFYGKEESQIQNDKITSFVGKIANKYLSHFIHITNTHSASSIRVFWSGVNIPHD